MGSDSDDDEDFYDPAKAAEAYLKVLRYIMDDTELDKPPRSLKEGSFIPVEGDGLLKGKTILNCVLPYYKSDADEKALTDLCQSICVSLGIKQCENNFVSSPVANMLPLQVYCHENNIKSVAFPPLGTGVLNTPVEKCAVCMSDGFRNFINKWKKEAKDKTSKKSKVLKLHEICKPCLAQSKF